jgi:hypothetical protein
MYNGDNMRTLIVIGGYVVIFTASVTRMKIKLNTPRIGIQDRVGDEVADDCFFSLTNQMMNQTSNPRNMIGTRLFITSAGKRGVYIHESGKNQKSTDC